MCAVQIKFPGFCDLQINGFAGVDFNDPQTTPDDLHRTLTALRATGVTRLLPTLITSPLENFAACARTLTGLGAPAIAGLHMEGPYISPDDGPRGAHRREYVCAASVEDFRRRQEAAGGAIRLVTLAPEVPGALELIEYLAAQKIIVAIGHSAATPEQIRDAIKAGARLSTHLGNGCALTMPRHPNLIWEQLAADKLTASFIMDGHHLPPATAKVMLRVKSAERSLLVTDAMAAAGCPPGRYKIGGTEVELSANGSVAAPGAQVLSGSSLTMPVAVANTVRFTDLPISMALGLASTLPAALLGLKPVGTVTADWTAAAGELKIQSVKDD
jgi:N-acetylglucosamine-6-phosphate deacetylase